MRTPTHPLQDKALPCHSQISENPCSCRDPAGKDCIKLLQCSPSTQNSIFNDLKWLRYLTFLGFSISVTPAVHVLLPLKQENVETHWQEHCGNQIVFWRMIKTEMIIQLSASKPGVKRIHIGVFCRTTISVAAFISRQEKKQTDRKPWKPLLGKSEQILFVKSLQPAKSPNAVSKGFFEKERQSRSYCLGLRWNSWEPTLSLPLGWANTPGQLPVLFSSDCAAIKGIKPIGTVWETRLCLPMRFCGFWTVFILLDRVKLSFWSRNTSPGKKSLEK